MAQKRSSAGRSRSKKNRPVEIPMTDLEGAGERDSRREDIHAAGTPGGGTAYGGLAGTNIGDGSPDNAHLEDAMGSGIADNDDVDDAEGATDAYGGPEGGAVGGTPAGGRARGGRTHHGLAPGSSRRGDSTIGSEPDKA